MFSTKLGFYYAYPPPTSAVVALPKGGAGYTGQQTGYSRDGISWRTVNLPTASGCNGACYGANTFISLRNPVSNRVDISTSRGATWTPQTLPLSLSLRAITYGSNTFVAVSNSNVAVTSPDGVTWTQQTLPVSSNWTSIAYGANTFVAVSSNSNVIITSSDGITWAQQTLPISANLTVIGYGANSFMALGGNTIITSPTGNIWIQGSALPVSSNWTGIAFGNDRILAVTPNTTSILSIDNGNTWTQQTIQTTAPATNSGSRRNVVFANQYFILPCGGNIVTSGTIFGIQISSDGINWTPMILQASDYRAYGVVAYGE